MTLVPSVRLVACSACAELVKSQERICPHCGAAQGGGGTVFAAAIASLMVGCVPATPLYGVPATESGLESTGAPASSDGTIGGSETGGEGTDTDGGTTVATPTTGEGGTTVDTDGCATETDSGTDTDCEMTTTDGPATTALYGVAAT